MYCIVNAFKCTWSRYLHEGDVQWLLPLLNNSGSHKQFSLIKFKQQKCLTCILQNFDNLRAKFNQNKFSQQSWLNIDLLSQSLSRCSKAFDWLAVNVAKFSEPNYSNIPLNLFIYYETLCTRYMSRMWNTLRYTVGWIEHIDSSPWAWATLSNDATVLKNVINFDITVFQIPDSIEPFDFNGSCKVYCLDLCCRMTLRLIQRYFPVSFVTCNECWLT